LKKSSTFAPALSKNIAILILKKKKTKWLTELLTSALLAAPASMSAPSELSAKATSTRLTRTLALAAVPALALAPPVPSRRVNRSQIQAKKPTLCVGFFL
jgi:hypothetical protein